MSNPRVLSWPGGWLGGTALLLIWAGAGGCSLHRQGGRMQVAVIEYGADRPITPDYVFALYVRSGDFLSPPSRWEPVGAYRPDASEFEVRFPPFIYAKWHSPLPRDNRKIYGLMVFARDCWPVYADHYVFSPFREEGMRFEPCGYEPYGELGSACIVMVPRRGWFHATRDLGDANRGWVRRTVEEQAMVEAILQAHTEVLAKVLPGALAQAGRKVPNQDRIWIYRQVAFLMRNALIMAPAESYRAAGLEAVEGELRRLGAPADPPDDPPAQ